MMRRKIRLALVSVLVSPFIYVIGLLQPAAILLDMPFSLAYYVADRYGMWQQGLLWAVNHRYLAIMCFLIWPLLVSTVLSCLIIWVVSKIWSEGKRQSRSFAVIFIIAVFGLILSIRVAPGSYFLSYYGYWIANY
jgi:hypothetical protein